MKECSKSIQRRLSDSNFVRKYFVGSGIDIGGKPDPLVLYKEFFPLMKNIKTWDWEDGDAQFLNSLEDDGLDFIHSSHCLEHLADPKEGLNNWFRVLRPGGYMVVSLPDEDMYEQGIFPSEFNRDHKWTFTIYKKSSWSERSLNVIDLIVELGNEVEVIKVELLTATYRYNLPRFDQTLTPVGECGIEFIIRKRPADEIKFGEKMKKLINQPEREVRIHLNQYRDDMMSMKRCNGDKLPFENDSEI